MKKLLSFLTLFAFSTNVLAGLPPTTVKGQSETSAPTTFNVQAPYNQATTTAAVTRLIETGYQNLLLNPSFEATTFNTSWTNANSTVTVDTTNVNDGKKSALMTMSAQVGSISQSVTPTIQLFGQNLEYGAWVKTTLTTVQVCPLQAAAVVGICTPAPSDGLWHYVAVNYPGPASGSIGVQVSNTSSSTGTFNVDNLYVGRARNLGVASVNTDFVAWTPTFTNLGTVTNIEMYSRRIGDSLQIQGQFQCGTPSAAEARMSLGFAGVDGNVTTINTGTLIKNAGLYWRTNNPVTDKGGIVLSEQAKTYFTFGTTAGIGSTSVNAGLKANGSSVCGTSTDLIQINATIPIAGWTAQPVVQISNANTDWVAYTPTITGAGTATNATNTSYWRRNGDSIELKINFTTGTVAASSASVTLPNGLTTNVSKLNTNFNNIVGYSVYGSNATSQVVLLAPTTSSNTLLFGEQDATHPGLTAQNGSTVWASTTNQSYYSIPIPITGWSNNQSAPLLVGSVTSPTSGLEATVRAAFGDATINTACASATCTIYRQSGGISSITRSTTGTYVINFISGTFSGAPSCSFSQRNANNAGAFSVLNSPTSTTYGFFERDFTSTLQDVGGDLMCQGPK